jgi:two-component SAPR family response regulator
MPELVQTLPVRFMAIPSKRLLVVEDECLVALMIADILVELGCNIVGPAFTISEARRLASNGPIDAALVDVNLNGVRADEVVDILSRRKIPFLFVTGYDSLPIDFRMDADLLKKPFGQDDLRRAIQGLLPACSVDPALCADTSFVSG